MSNLVKNVQNLNNNVKGIFWFFGKIPAKKLENPTKILAWKFSLPLIANKAINQLLTRSI